MAALSLAVCGLDRKARDLRRSYKKPPRERELPRQRKVGEPTETDRAKQTHPRLDPAVGATQVASFSTRSAAPLPPYRRSGIGGAHGDFERLHLIALSLRSSTGSGRTISPVWYRLCKPTFQAEVR